MGKTSLRRVRFIPRSSGQITTAFDSGLILSDLEIPVYQTHSFKSGKSLAPGRAAGGNIELNGYKLRKTGNAFGGWPASSHKARFS
jgi:hypothetical protein